MADDMRDDAMNASAERAAALLREDVPVRGVWRDALIARIEREPLSSRRRWTINPPLALAAGLVILAVGVAAGRFTRAPQTAITTAASTPATTPTVRFVYVAPGAKQVSVVGDFNQWNPTALPLRRLGDGTWIIDVPLTPGSYVYAFVVDGSIKVDPTAPRADDGDFGVNSVLMVRGS